MNKINKSIGHTNYHNFFRYQIWFDLEKCVVLKYVVNIRMIKMANIQLFFEILLQQFL